MLDRTPRSISVNGILGLGKDNTTLEGVAVSSDNERLLVAQWVLERNLSWIAAVEVKVGVIVAIDTALLGSLGAAFSSSGTAVRTAWAYLWTVGAGVATVAGLFCAAMAVLPRLSGPAKSLVFFGRVGNLDEPEYIEKFKSATDTQLLEDWTAQIHRNAQIACNKFAWVHASMSWSFLSVVPWLAAIITLLQK